MQTELLSSAVHCALRSRAGQASFSPFFFFFFEHIAQILEKRPAKSIKSMNGFSSKTQAFKGKTEGYWEMGDVLGVDSWSCWNKIMRNRISEKITSDVKILLYIWASPNRKKSGRKSDGGRLRRCVGDFVCVGVWVCVLGHVCVCVFMGENECAQTSQSLCSTEGPVKLPLCLIKTPHLWATVSMNPASHPHQLLI